MWPLSLPVIPTPHILNPKARDWVGDDPGKSSREETEDGGICKTRQNVSRDPLMEPLRGASVCPSARALWKEILKGDAMVGSRGEQTDGGVCPGMEVCLRG